MLPKILYRLLGREGGGNYGSNTSKYFLPHPPIFIHVSHANAENIKTAKIRGSGVVISVRVTRAKQVNHRKSGKSIAWGREPPTPWASAMQTRASQSCKAERASTVQTKPPLCRPCLRYAVNEPPPYSTAFL